MTPNQRAEKIVQDVLDRQFKSSVNLIDLVAAQITQAVEEAVRDALCHENPDIDKDLDEAYAKGFSEAREMAAGIAVQCVWDWNKEDGKSRLTFDMRERIRAMSPKEGV